MRGHGPGLKFYQAQTPKTSVTTSGPETQAAAGGEWTSGGYGYQHCLCEPTYLAWRLLPSSLWVSFHSFCLSLTCFFFAFLSDLDRLASFTDDLGVPPSICLPS